MRPYPLLLLNCLYIFWFLAIILKVHPPLHRLQYTSSILSLCSDTICMLPWYLNKGVAVYMHTI